MTPIHFRGAGPAVAAVLAGEPSAGAMSAVAPLSHIRSGKLRALAVSGAKRIAALADVPTFTELGFPSLQDYVWVGIFLPVGTPSAIIQKLNESVNRAIQSADVRERLEAQAFELVGGSQQQTAEYVTAELVKWGKVVRDTGAKPD